MSSSVFYFWKQSLKPECLTLMTILSGKYCQIQKTSPALQPISLPFYCVSYAADGTIQGNHSTDSLRVCGFFCFTRIVIRISISSRESMAISFTMGYSNVSPQISSPLSRTYSIILSKCAELLAQRFF